MVGTSNKYWIILLAASLLTFSCTKEIEMASVDEGERVYDPLVRFGLETYQVKEPATKTAYAGDDQRYELNSVQYERINWNVKPTAEDAHLDTVCVKAELDFTQNNKQSVDYRAVEIVGRTNRTGTLYSEADTAPASGDAKDNLYWSSSLKDRYFYAMYPSPSVKKATLRTFDIDASTHTATVEGEIPANQPYLFVRKTGTPGTPGAPACIEYLPNMNNAYMYAAAKVPGVDAGFRKVPLRFKPLFSAVKLIITAREMGAESYRLKKVVLRTDINIQDLYMRPDVDGPGTALAGKFTASFKTDAKGTTADFSLVGAPTDTLKKLTIEIPEADRFVLGEDTLKLTFLALPVKQKYLTVDYTFERWDGTQWREVRRTLALQNASKMMQDAEWYELDAAHKLYIRSRVPDIEYFFKVQAQGNFPRTWNSADDKKDGTHFYSDDFYSVQSYRDSAGVKQSMKWKVTGYKKPGDLKFEMGNRPSWLTLRGDDGTWNPDEEITDVVHHGWDATGDPWEEPWGAGTPMENGDFAKNSIFSPHVRNYMKETSFVSYVAAAEANEEGYSRNESVDADGKPDVFEDNRDWDVPVSFLCKDLEGNYYYPKDHPHIPSAGWKGLEGESYAYDLSSHDIYGNLYTGLKNGDLGTTANTYVVSAPGWYRFPAVYGCSVKNGVDNNKSYTGAEGFHLLKTFLNHADEDITSPAISGIADVDVLWDDATHMVAPGTTVLSRADRKPFYHKDPSETYGYIYFYVDDIAQGNALLVAKDDGGTIVWSWQIWAVTKPETFLKKVGVESNSLDVNDNPNPYKSIYGTNYFWQKADLGQHGKESGIVEPRYCDVEFTQYFQGKELKKVVVRFLQSGVNDVQDEPIFYQWGRKDPMPRNKFGITGITSGINTQNTGRTIREPNVFFGGTAYYVPTGERYDNLWNTNITAAPTTPESDGTSTGSLDRYVEKTIYDPSPPGFHTANLYALSGFNPVSPINETKIRVAEAEEVAKGARTTPVPKYNNYRYFDFFTEYDESATFKRKKDGETIRFYVLGRLKANEFIVDFDYQAFYFLSEPGSWVSNSVYYGRSFWIGTDPVLPDPYGKYSTWWNIYPVAGATNSPKWQRNHALSVRPMMEP